VSRRRAMGGEAGAILELPDDGDAGGQIRPVQRFSGEPMPATRPFAALRLHQRLRQRLRTPDLASTKPIGSPGRCSPSPYAFLQHRRGSGEPDSRPVTLLSAMDKFSPVIFLMLCILNIFVTNEYNLLYLNTKPPLLYFSAILCSHVIPILCNMTT
jgi:hypothetical protein